MKKLFVVSDWVDDSLSCNEFKTATVGYLQDPSHPHIDFVSSTPSSIHTAFIVSQLVQTEERLGRPLETIVFQNTDPRTQSDEGVETAHGAQFIIIRLQSGIYLCGPNAGYNFSMIKHKIEEVYTYKGLQDGGSFKSRELYSRICAHLMDTMQDELDLEEISSNIIPGLAGFYVTHIDNFGTLKTNITVEDFKGKHEYDDEVEIKINGVTKTARFVNTLFGGIVGELVVYPGCYGDTDNPFMEIGVWRSFSSMEKVSNLNFFNSPLPGTVIEIIVS